MECSLGKLAFLLLSLLTIDVIAAESDCKHTTNSFACVRYLSNYDGDTVRFEIPNVHPLIGKNISIRIDGLDTPEIRTKDHCEKKLAKTARNRVKQLLSKAKRIDLENVQRGKYFRIVANVKVDGLDLSELLLKEKLAYKYDGGKKQKPNWCTFQKPTRLPTSR